MQNYQALYQNVMKIVFLAQVGFKVILISLIKTLDMDHIIWCF